MSNLSQTTIEQILASADTPKLKVDELVKLAYAAIAEAEVLAEAGSFTFSFELTYGMGGTYGEQWDASRDEEGNTPYGWNASSQSC
jgi:hypothetical protein